MATTVLLRLAALTGEGRYRDGRRTRARERRPVLAALPDRLRPVAHRPRPGARAASPRSPSSAAAWRPATRPLLEVVDAPYRPHQVLAGATDPGRSAVPLLADRERREGRPTAYVCRDFVCRLPVTDAAALTDELSAVPA